VSASGLQLLLYCLTMAPLTVMAKEACDFFAFLLQFIKLPFNIYLVGFPFLIG
jgi:hypothetical protein